LTFGGGRFVAVSGGNLLTSDINGETWSTFQAPPDDRLTAIGFGNDVFVLVGRRIWTSRDLTTWTPRTEGTAVSGYVPFYYPGFTSGGVTWTGDRFVVVGHNGQVYSSADGESWTADTPGTHHNLAAVAYSPDLGQLVALGESVATYSKGKIR
jgi:hypothetical protein